MNILIPYSWLKEFLETKATPKEIAQYLSLCSQSVEKVTKKGSDWIYEIEVTTNRPDCLSVYGIARELQAILPRFGIKAKLQKIPEEKIKIPTIKKGLSLKVKIEDFSLCPRFTTIIFDKVTIGPSPKIIQDRLQKVGIRPLNNVVDISNYLMIELGQPMHTFDYDKIREAKMTLRSSKEGERIITLDGKTHVLPSGAIVIEDGEGRLVDLCGIMGGKNSQVDEKTTRVLLFVQTYPPLKIRRTCQALGFRTEAASRFEKGVDPEGIILAMKKAIVMFKKNCQARLASSLIDIYPRPYKEKKVSLSQKKLTQIIGIEVKLEEAKRILESLGFLPELSDNHSKLIATVPHWRYEDISLSEDLVEEIARIYGYHNLPSRLPKGEIPKTISNKKFYWEEKTEDFLKYLGFTQVYTYSFTSASLLKKCGFNYQNCWRILNPLASEWEYMRPSLIPGILKVIAQNQSFKEEIKIFELSKVYLKKEEKPKEKTMLVGALTGKKFYQAKGIVEAFLEELGIKMVTLESTIVDSRVTISLWHPGRTAKVLFQKKGKEIILGKVGEIHPYLLQKMGIEKRVTIFELDFEKISAFATTTKTYTPIPKYPPIVEDLAFLVPPKLPVGEIMKEIKKTSKLIAKVSLLDSYQNTRTFRVFYQHPQKTLTTKEVETIRKKIIKKLKKEFGIKLKSL